MPIFFNQRCKCFAPLLARLHNVNCLYFIIVVDCCCTNFQYRTYLCISNLDVKVCLYLNTLKIYLVFASETLSTLSKNFFPSQDFFTQFGFHSNFHKYSWSQHTMAHFPSTVIVCNLVVGMNRFWIWLLLLLWVDVCRCGITISWSWRGQGCQSSLLELHIITLHCIDWGEGHRASKSHTNVRSCRSETEYDFRVSHL